MYGNLNIIEWFYSKKDEFEFKHTINAIVYKLIVIPPSPNKLRLNAGTPCFQRSNNTKTPM